MNDGTHIDYYFQNNGERDSFVAYLMRDNQQGCSIVLACG